MQEDVSFQPIGIIHSPFKEPENMPIQTTGAQGVKGTVELDPQFAAGLKDLDGFSHIVLIYYFHLSEGYSLEVKPFLDETMRGVFATRAPRRPNSIGISIVKLARVEGSTLHVQDVDVVDGTPLLDIKPYVPEFDAKPAERIGWLEGKAKGAGKQKSDNRFG